MKKLLSVLVMLVLCAMGTNAQVLPELEGKAVCVGNALANFEPDTWYFLHQARLSNGGEAGTHSTVGEQPISGGFLWDTGAGNTLYKSELSVVKQYVEDDEDLATTPINVAAKYMVRFVESPEYDGAYIIQFGTGNYVTAELKSDANKNDAVSLNVYLIGGNEGHFGLNEWNMKRRLDNNGSGSTIAWYSNGEITDLGGNNDWAIHEVVFAAFNENKAAYDELCALVQDEYYGRDEELATQLGTAIGQYDEAAFDAFCAAMTAGWDIKERIEAGESIDAETIKAAIKAIRDTYEAVLATRVHYVPADGYYNIVSMMTWTNTETIPAEEEGEEPTTIETHPTKAMYVSGTNLKWGNYDPESCTFLWKLEATEETDIFTLTSMAVDAGVNNIVTSQGATMAEGPTNVRLQYIRTDEDGNAIITFTGATQTGAQQFAHCGGHSGGAGVGGSIVGWGWNGIPASEWTLVAVDADDAAEIIAAYEPIKNHDVLVENYNTMKADALEKLEAAKEIMTKLHEDQPLITEAGQFSSEYTTTDEQRVEGEPATEEDVYGFLLDGNPATYWHSKWEAGNVAGGTHYLQVELPEGSETLTGAAFKLTRRAVANDHITVWGVYGTNDPDAEKADCELLAEVETPFGNNTETIVSPAFPLKGHAYVRFYINNTVGSGISATRGYGHMSEFQLYPAENVQRDPNQYATLGNIATDLEALLEAQADLTNETLGVEAYNALKAAYDAFIARYTDPAPLRNKIASLETLLNDNYIKLGTNPGEWSDASAAASFKATYEAAVAYDLAAVYYPEQSAKWIADLDESAVALTAAANQIKEGKWYYFRFGTEAEYDANNWSKGNAEGAENGNTVHPELFGKYVTVAAIEQYEEGGYDINEIETDEVVVGNNLYFLDKEMGIEDADQAKWRFVNVGDTAYVIQNKATGLFMRAAGTSGSVTLSVHPTLFAAPKAIGYGQTITTGRTLDGANCNNLHAQRDHNTLVTWAAAEAGTNSGLVVEEAEDVAADYDGTQCGINVVVGSVNTFCYPVEMTCTDKESVLYAATLNGTELTLNPLKDNKANAGQPFVLINGDTEAYVAPAEGEDYDYTRVTFTHGYDVAREAGTLASLVGTYTSTKIGAGKVVAKGNTLAVTKKSAETAAANSAYIVTEEGFDLDSELTIVISSDIVDGVSEALAAVSRTGAIYTLDGRRVATGNVNTLRQLGRGIYIINGAKVVVK